MKTIALIGIVTVALSAASSGIEATAQVPDIFVNQQCTTEQPIPGTGESLESQCTPAAFVGDAPTKVDTRCDQTLVCTEIRLDDGSNSLNILTTGGANIAAADDLTWGGATVWTASSDGSDSGLDADTLDGFQGSSYVQADQDSTTILAGRVSSSGAIVAGSGFSVTKFRTGGYIIAFDAPFSLSPVVTGTLESSTTNGQVVVESLSTTMVQVGTSNAGGSSQDSMFHFMAVGPR